MYVWAQEYVSGTIVDIISDEYNNAFMPVANQKYKVWVDRKLYNFGELAIL